MNLPNSELHQEYTDGVKVIEANLKDIASGDAPYELYDYAQSKLDKLAERFQYDETLGAARYKLYELQALLYYFQNRDDDALAFIEQAIETKGSSYKRAKQLIEQINLAPAATPVYDEPTPEEEMSNFDEAIPKEEPNVTEKHEQLVGLGGWLTLFIIGLIFSTILSIIELSDYPSTINDIASLKAELPDLTAALVPALWFEVLEFTVIIIASVILLILLIQHKYIAKGFAIGFLISSAILVIIDYLWASQILNAYDVAQYMQSEISEAAGDVWRNIAAACIWVPYFLVSKRVKATLRK